MNYLKRHKFTAVVIVVFIVCVMLLFFSWKTFFSNSGNPVYGNRLDGIESVEIKESDFNKIKEDSKKNNKVKDVNVNVSGRTLEIVILVDDNLSISDAKKIGNDSFVSLSDKQKDYYSIQVFIKKGDASKNNFPIIGYKQKESKNLVWTKDRKVTSTNEK